MVDLAKSSATAISTTPDKSQKAKPEKPDEQLYKDNLQKAERDYAATQEKVVRSWASSSITVSQTRIAVLQHWPRYVGSHKSQDRQCATVKQGLPGRNEAERASFTVTTDSTATIRIQVISNECTGKNCGAGYSAQVSWCRAEIIPK